MILHNYWLLFISILTNFLCLGDIHQLPVPVSLLLIATPIEGSSQIIFEIVKCLALPGFENGTFGMQSQCDN